jgi:hypothetical protein
MTKPSDITENSGELRCYALLRDLPERMAIERFYDDDSMIVVGWKDTREALVVIGSNTAFNRELGDFIAESIKAIAYA